MQSKISDTDQQVVRPAPFGAGLFRNLACAALAVALGSAGIAGAAERIEVQGHRGARAMRPENTLPAMEYALEVGVDTLELDVSITKDDVLVLSHDPLINPDICLAAGGQRVEGKIPIRSLTLAQLKTFDCGSLRNPKFPDQQTVPGTRIPTLDEVFDMVKASKAPSAKTVQFNIETKIVPRYTGLLTPEPAVFAKLLVDLVKKHGMQKRVVAQSFDHRSLAAVRALEKTIRISPLFGENLVDIKAFVKSTKPDIVSPNLNWITEQYVKDAHAAGAKVIPWTANTVEEWDWLIQCGVDGIITDDPAKLIEHLKSKKLL